MKKTLLMAIATILSVVAVKAQSQFEIDKPFSQVALRGAIFAEFIPADEPKVVVTVHGAPYSKVEWSVKNQKLNITLRVGVVEQNKDIYAEVKIYYTDLSYIGVEGASLVNRVPIKSNDLKVETLGGKNDFELKVDADNIDVVASGDCKMTLLGSAVLLNIKALVGARVDCGACEANTVVATAKQRGEIIVRTSGEMSALATGGSNIFYIGTPNLSAVARLGSGVISVSEKRFE